MDILTQFDFRILDWMQTHLRCSFLDAVLPVFTHLGSAVSVILIACLFIAFRKTRKTGLMMGVALLLGVIIGNAVLKPLVARIRPYDINTDISLLISPMHDFSFPSGHSLASFELATVLLRRDRRIGIPALAAAILVAFSRLYLYVHYPSDVLAGILLGVLFGFLGVAIVDAAAEYLSRRKAGAGKTQ